MANLLTPAGDTHPEQSSGRDLEPKTWDDRLGALLAVYEAPVLLAARAALAEIFVLSGWGKIFAYEATIKLMESRGIPFPSLLVVPTILIEFGGGVALLLGLRARIAALFLIILIVLATYYFHLYWTFPEAQQRAQFLSFWKNGRDFRPGILVSRPVDSEASAMTVKISMQAGFVSVRGI